MVKSFFDKIKYEACIFIFLVLQFFLFVPDKDKMSLTHSMIYLVDYSHGFMPRGFIGEVISWFSPTVSYELLWTLCVIVCILICILISIIGGHIIKKSQDPTAVKVVIAIMVASPIFMPLMSNWLGIVDIHLILLTLISFLLNENKILRYLIPIIALTCVAIHYAYMFLYMVPLAIALLYDFFKNKKFVRDGILCGITYISLIAFALFNVSSRSAKGFSSAEEMIKYHLEKADFEFSSAWVESLIPYEYFSGVGTVGSMTTSAMSVSNLLGLVVIFAPIFVLFTFGWIKAIKKTEAKDFKAVLFLCLIHPLSVIPAYIFGLNWNRWTSAIITSQCILYLFMLYRRNDAVCSAFKEIIEFFKNHFIIVVLYLIYYASFAKLIGF